MWVLSDEEHGKRGYKMTDNNENEDKVTFLKAGEKQAVLDGLEKIETNFMRQENW